MKHHDIVQEPYNLFLDKLNLTDFYKQCSYAIGTPYNITYYFYNQSTYYVERLICQELYQAYNFYKLHNNLRKLTITINYMRQFNDLSTYFKLKY